MVVTKIIIVTHTPGGVQDSVRVWAAARAGEVRGAAPRDAGGRALAAGLRPRHRRPQAQEEGDPEDVPAGYRQNVPVVRTNICLGIVQCYKLPIAHACHRNDDDNLSSTFIFAPPPALIIILKTRQ